MATTKTVVSVLGLALSITLTGAAALGGPRVAGPAVAPLVGTLADAAGNSAVVADRPDTIPEL